MREVSENMETIIIVAIKYKIVSPKFHSSHSLEASIDSWGRWRTWPARPGSF